MNAPLVGLTAVLTEGTVRIRVWGSSVWIQGVVVVLERGFLCFFVPGRCFFSIWLRVFCVLDLAQISCEGFFTVFGRDLLMIEIC